MASLQVFSQPANQPTLSPTVRSAPASQPSLAPRVVTQPQQPTLAPKVVTQPAQPRLSPTVQSTPAGQPEKVNVSFGRIIDSIRAAQSRGASADAILKAIVAQNPDKQSVFDEALKRGATPEQILEKLTQDNYVPSPDVETKKGLFSRIKDDFAERGSNIKKSLEATAKGEQSFGEYKLQALGQVLAGAGNVAVEGATSLFRALPDSIENPLRKAGSAVLESEPVQKTVAAYGQWAEQNPRAARNLEAVLNIASVLPVGKGGQVAGKLATKTAQTGIRVGERAVGAGKNLIKFGTSQITGLAPDTIAEIVTNPTVYRAAQKAGLDRLSLANRVKDALDNRLATLSETGKGYEAIRKGAGQVEVPAGTIDNLLSKYGITLEDGKVRLTAESVPLSQGDISAIESFAKQYGSEQKLSANGFLNARKALSNMASYDAAKTDLADIIARELRGAYDELGKKQLGDLEALDSKYAPEIKQLTQLKRDYLNRDGSLKDGAINKIANLTGKGKDQVLDRLEQVAPGIGRDIRILKALEDVEYAKGQKVGAYARGAAGGFVLSGGNPAVAVISAIVSSPSIAVPILRTYGKLVINSKKVIDTIVGKLERGVNLNARESVIASEAFQRYTQAIAQRSAVSGPTNTDGL